MKNTKTQSKTETNNTKTKIVNKVSNKRSLMIMATWPIAGIAVLGFSFLTFSLVESKYYSKVDGRNLVTTDLSQRGIQLTSQQFANIVDKMEIDKDFAKYSASQILELARNSQSNFRLINIFNLGDFSSRYPFLKLNINPIENSDVEDKTLTTKVVNNNLVNVVFTAHDQLTNKTYSKVHSIRGFEGKGDIPFINFNVDQQKSSFILHTVEPTKKWNVLSFVDSLNNEYKKTKNAKTTLEKYGSFLLLDSNDVVIDFPDKTRFDFQTDSNGNIIFKNIKDSTGNLWIPFDIFDEQNKKIRSFDLKVGNLLDYNEINNYLNNLLKNNDDLIVLKDEKIQEMVAKNVSLSTFLISNSGIRHFFDTTKLDSLFTNSLPNFGIRLITANRQYDRLGQVDLMIQMNFKAKTNLSPSENQSSGENQAQKATEESEGKTEKTQPESESQDGTAPKTQSDSATENQVVQNQKTLKNTASLFQEAEVQPENQVEKPSVQTEDELEVQKNYRDFNFIYTLKPFKDLPQRYLNSAIKDNDYYVIKDKFNYLNGSEIINNLKTINASFYSFEENKDTNKGYEIVNLTSSPTYDSLTSQKAIVAWFKDFFNDSLEFPSWKKTKPTEKPEEILAEIFAKMNNIINSKQIFSYGVKYNLFFDNLARELKITISIHDKFNKVLGKKVVKLAGLAPANPPLFVAKQNLATFFIDGGGGYKLKDQNNFASPKNIEAFKSITNPQVLITTVKNQTTNSDKTIKLVKNGEVLHPSLNDEPLKFVYQTEENKAYEDVTFDEKKPFFFGFSVQNNLENGKHKVLLSFSKKETGTTENNNNNLIWMKRFDKKSEVKPQISDDSSEIPDDSPVWVIGVSKKNEIATAQNGQPPKKIIGILPVEDGQFTNFVLSYNGFSENSATSGAGQGTSTNKKIKVKIASSKSKNQPEIELEEDFWGTTQTSGTAQTNNLSLILGDSENKSTVNSEVLFRFFTQFQYEFSDKKTFEEAFNNSLK
ncbi:Uncharacterised protein [Mesomycoplasma dispar]|uniref:Uncharacterized protein n=1 Tax=Mesomycoplasma dispar TaxID=86660 RepID=A0AAJ5NQK3_9BACT|nr:P110/LppT family adhesin N-terminal domain [Mesomycoplasma dispar]AJR12452.1 hypothetical protein MDIS_03800 [Mesomycoplasma dispar]VEU62622.1 Uncharacterised protein [Mesomycoplasma dispar]